MSPTQHNGLLVALAVAVFAIGPCNPLVQTPNRLVLHNVSREPLSVSLSISDGSEHWDVNLAPGELTSVAFKVDGDSDVEVVVRKGSTLAYSRGAGYFDPSLGGVCLWLELGGAEMRGYDCR